MAEKEYRRGLHTLYDIKYHVVWVTKYRYKVLIGEIATRTRDVIRQICMAREIKILKGHVSRDHVHLFVSCPPGLSVSQMMQYIKGKSSHVLQNEFRELKRRYWGQHLWARGYFCASSGHGDRCDDQGLYRATGPSSGRRVHGGRREALAGFSRRAGLAASVNFQLRLKPTGFKPVVV